MLAPDQTPKAVITRLNAEAEKVAQREDVKKLLLRSGVETVGGSPEEFALVIKTEVVKWARVVKAAGIERR